MCVYYKMVAFGECDEARCCFKHAPVQKSKGSVREGFRHADFFALSGLFFRDAYTLRDRKISYHSDTSLIGE